MGVAILSSVVASVYSHRISGDLRGTALPGNLQQAASDSIGATYEVAGQLAQRGVPAAQIQRLLDAANSSFMPAFHLAALVAMGLLIVAVVVVLTRLPTQAETVDWSATTAEPQADEAPAPPKSRERRT